MVERFFLDGKLLIYGPPLLLFISGDKSQVGKSSVCLGLIAALLDIFSASELAYIKPATQCEQEQLVTSFCRERGIDFVEETSSPIIFYAGFTRAFLANETASSSTMLQDVKKAVDELSVGKKVVIVDGVGYPAVGSICGVSNADIARTLNAPVILVGITGMGNAVDSFNLNSTFFEHHEVRVIGTIINRCSLDGYYSIDKIEPCIRKYFEKQKPHQEAFGFLPEMAQPVDAEQLIKSFKEHVNVRSILKRAALARGTTAPSQPVARVLQQADADAEPTQVRKREDVTQAARKSGAGGG
eukprot:GEMP01038333.1.p1 GENE.GEMP01038333.1~~GEMP01038333.1.p1  ORF type:complete len:299 (+),score=71.34 GEMP01038333.1:122-1018(+)